MATWVSPVVSARGSQRCHPKEDSENPIHVKNVALLAERRFATPTVCTAQCIRQATYIMSHAAFIYVVKKRRAFGIKLRKSLFPRDLIAFSLVVLSHGLVVRREWRTFDMRHPTFVDISCRAMDIIMIAC